MEREVDRCTASVKVVRARRINTGTERKGLDNKRGSIVPGLLGFEDPTASEPPTVSLRLSSSQWHPRPTPHTLTRVFFLRRLLIKPFFTKQRTCHFSKMSFPSSAPRSHALRAAIIQAHDQDAFDYPFGVTNELAYSIEDIVEPLLTQSATDAVALAGDFPNNIAQWIWSRPGQKDGDSWLLLCRLNTGAYAFFSGWCDYTGFDCQGGMKLTVSKVLADVIEHGMETATMFCMRLRRWLSNRFSHST